VQRIEPGAVNLMTAGKGITHSERSPADERQGGPHLSGIQTWLALPLEKEEVDPGFEHVSADRLPSLLDDGVRVSLVMGEWQGSVSPVTQHSPIIYAAIELAPGFDPEALRAVARERFQVAIAGGLGPLHGRVFRIGHLGDVNEAMILGCLGGVEAALQVQGIPCARGGVDAAIAALLASDER
jgi:redox-sensitive bicupin YhaK (pirin superfamily)